MQINETEEPKPAGDTASVPSHCGRRSLLKFLRARSVPFLSSLVALVRRVWGLVVLGVYVVFFVGPPVVLLVFLGIGGAFTPLEIPPDSLVTALLTATGTTAALAALCFSYSRAVENSVSKAAGVASGRMLLGGAVALSVALAAHYAGSLDALAPTDSPSPFAEFIVSRSLTVTLTFTPILISLGMLRMYLHLLRLAAISWVHTFDSLEGRAERDKRRLFD